MTTTIEQQGAEGLANHLRRELAGPDGRTRTDTQVTIGADRAEDGAHPDHYVPLIEFPAPDGNTVTLRFQGMTYPLERDAAYAAKRMTDAALGMLMGDKAPPSQRVRSDDGLLLPGITPADPAAEQARIDQAAAIAAVEEAMT